MIRWEISNFDKNVEFTSFENWLKKSKIDLGIGQ